MNFLMKPKIKTLFLILAFSIVSFFTYPTYGEELSGVQKEVWKMQESEWKFWKKGDGEGRLALYHKDCTIWRFSATFPGDKSQIRQELNYNSTIDSPELEPQEVKVFDNVAIVQYSLKYTIMGKDFKQRVMATWMKQDGKWIIIGSMRSKHPSPSDLGAGQHG